MIGLVVAGAGAGLLVSLVLMLLIGRTWDRERDRDRRMDALLSAATGGDTEHLRQTVDQGRSVDQPDRWGNTALHLAFYTGQREAVAHLRAFGADGGLRNDEGLTPPEMAEVAAAEALLREGAARVTTHGTWRDERRARLIYDRLRDHPAKIFTPALVRVVLAHGDRRRLLILAIKIGARGSEGRLVEVLEGFGDRGMAVDYLNAGSEVLREAAEGWARRRGYRIHYRSGRPGVTWGRF